MPPAPTRIRPTGTGARLGRSGSPSALAVGDVLARAVRARGWEERLRALSVVQRWSDLVGPEIARHARPVRVRGGVLVIATRHQTWAAQLSFLRSDLLRRLRTESGGAIRDLSFDVRWDLGDEGASAPPAVPARDPTARSTPSPRPDAPPDLPAAFAAWRAAALRRQGRIAAACDPPQL